MKTSTRVVFLNVTSYAYLLLFIYAAVSKLLDFEQFQVQLGQSPMLSSFAGFISVAVPLSELAISLMLAINRTRRLGLYFGFLLMSLFTAYIFIILHYSSFVPCSCGGILEKMGWEEHFYFNLAFVITAGLALTLNRATREGVPRENRHPFAPVMLIAAVALSGPFMLGLYHLSDTVMHRHNNFTRHFPHHPIEQTGTKDLKMNSYYIAGLDDSHIYLGNVTAPLVIVVLNHKLKELGRYKIKLSDETLPFRSIKIAVQPPYFYVTDGTVPVIFRGKVGLWSANRYDSPAFFTSGVVTDSTSMVVRSTKSDTHESVLGALRFGDHPAISLKNGVLTRQLDGVFDTDGMLLYNPDQQKIIYTYFYRNQFIIGNPDLSEITTGKTIDTVAKANLKIAHLESRKESKLASPALTVNKNTATAGRQLMVHSSLMGRYEPAIEWERSSIIDVYDLLTRDYSFSFYIPHKDKEKMSEFKAKNRFMVCLTGNHIITYRLDGGVFK